MCFGYNERAHEIRNHIDGNDPSNMQAFVNVFLDFYNIEPGSNRARVLKHYLCDLRTSGRQTLLFSHPPLHVDGTLRHSDAGVLPLEVECYVDCTNPSSALHGYFSFIRTTHPGVVDFPPEIQQYRILNMPSVEMLLSWGRPELVQRAKYSHNDNESRLDDLLLAYANHDPPLPLVSSTVIAQGTVC